MPSRLASGRLERALTIDSTPVQRKVTGSSFETTFRLPWAGPPFRPGAFSLNTSIWRTADVIAKLKSPQEPTGRLRSPELLAFVDALADLAADLYLAGRLRNPAEAQSSREPPSSSGALDVH